MDFLAKDTATLKKSFKNSLLVITSREDYNHGLLGLVRVVGDGETIIYIQDLLVREKYRRQGIGTELIKMVLKKYKHVRQKVLITDDTEETRLFYESLGFNECGEKDLLGFVKIGK